MSGYLPPAVKAGYQMHKHNGTWQVRGPAANADPWARRSGWDPRLHFRRHLAEPQRNCVGSQVRGCIPRSLSVGKRLLLPTVYQVRQRGAGAPGLPLSRALGTSAAHTSGRRCSYLFGLLDAGGEAICRADVVLPCCACQLPWCLQGYIDDYFVFTCGPGVPVRPSHCNENCRIARLLCSMLYVCCTVHAVRSFVLGPEKEV
jgi:hypothetical protein